MSDLDPKAILNLSYGLFIMTTKNNVKDTGRIINTAMQLTSDPQRLMVGLHKSGYTHNIVLESGIFNINILTEHTPFSVIQHFGMKSGADMDKFDDSTQAYRSKNGLIYLPDYSNAIISCRVTDAFDYKTHTAIVADVTESLVISDAPSVTYQYYLNNIKPQPEQTKGFACTICGYVYKGDNLPADFICPICKHTAEVFEPLK